MSSSPARSHGSDVADVDVSAIVIDDGAPVDNIISEKQMRLLTEPLYATWGGPPPDEDGEPRTFVAFANVGVFATPKDPPLVPDVFVSLDVELHPDMHRKEHRSYFVWEFGKVPDVVIEIVSNREGGELDTKKRKYARMRVPSYVVWDPDAILGERRLQTFELRGHIYTRTDRCFFEGLGLGLTEWTGPYEDFEYRWLRWHDAQGRLVLTGAERADAADVRAEQAGARAEQADARAKQADARAERLAEKLLALGVDPASVK